MPFPTHILNAYKAYTRADIEWLTPNQYGVYGIYRANVCVYIGRGDIRSRLLDHLNGDNPRISRENPNYYVAMVTADAERLEAQLIAEYDPIANRQLKR